jgi:hypothetical protein
MKYTVVGNGRDSIATSVRDITGSSLTATVDPDSDNITPSIVIAGPDGTPLLCVDFTLTGVQLGSYPYHDDEWVEFAHIGLDGTLNE